MCETKNRDALRNGHASDQVVQGHALADIIDGLSALQAQLRELPTRSEVREMIKDSLAVHADACAHGRATSAKAPEDSRFKMAVGKIFGVETSGRAGMIILAILWLVVGGILALAIRHAGELAGIWR